jgi:hypothetical protein
MSVTAIEAMSQQEQAVVVVVISAATSRVIIATVDLAAALATLQRGLAGEDCRDRS